MVREPLAGRPHAADERGVNDVKSLALQMPAADQVLLSKRTLQTRQDYKFLLSVDHLPQLLEGLAGSHAVLWAGNEVLADYETLYFDTEDRQCFHDHRRGRRKRYKVRARTYAERRVTMLEVKRKQCGGTVKSRLERSFQNHGLDASGRLFIAEHSPLLPEQLRPVLGNRFRRLTLLGLQAEQRITFDLALSFGDQAGSRQLRHVVVAEVKSAARRCRTPALQHFSESGLRPSRMSKYCVGTALLNPGVRANRFGPVLRNIRRLENA